MKNALAFVAVASCVSALCRAASPPSLAESLQACAKMADVTERVRCYDAVAAASLRRARTAITPSGRPLFPLAVPPNDDVTGR